MSRQREHLLDAYHTLRRQCGDLNQWVGTETGADFWMDGFDAIRSTPPEIFTPYADAFLDFLTRMDSSLRLDEESRIHETLELFDAFLEAAGKGGEAAFWHVLAVGFSLLAACGQPARVLEGASIINDSLLLLLSPNYRALRFHAYNEGVQVFASDRPAPPFRPEYGYFVAAPPYLVLDPPPHRVQQYNINHDLAHIVLFADAYLRPVGTPEMTASLLLNAEETSCAVDLFTVRDLSRFGVQLHALTEFKRIEKGFESGLETSVACKAGSDPELIVQYQTALKAAAQKHLHTTSVVSEKLLQRAAIPDDLGDWISPRAQKMHAEWCEHLAERVHDPVFQKFVSLLPARTEHLVNLLRFTEREWGEGELVTEGTVPALDAVKRQSNLEHQHRRWLVIRAAEIAQSMREETSFVEDLHAWAFQAALGSQSPAALLEAVRPLFSGAREDLFHLLVNRLDAPKRLATR